MFLIFLLVQSDSGSEIMIREAEGEGNINFSKYFLLILNVYPAHYILRIPSNLEGTSSKDKAETLIKTVASYYAITLSNFQPSRQISHC